MTIARLSIRHPVGSILLALAIVLAGCLAWWQLPVSPLPQVDIPMVLVTANLPGASPGSMAATVAGPLERALGAIPGLSAISSVSSTGSTEVRLIFDIERPLDDAARDVQAAINGAIASLPAGMPARPTFRKINPSTAPMMALAISSDTLSPGELYELADSLVLPALARVSGVGEVSLGGASLPAVRIRFEPVALAAIGMSLEQARQALAAAGAETAQGAVEDPEHRWLLASGPRLKTAADFSALVLRWKNGQAVRLADVAEVSDSVENRYRSGFHNHRPAVIVLVRRQPSANVVATIEAIRATLPTLQVQLPPQADLSVVMDRSLGIRSSLAEAQRTLLLSCLIVALVAWLFMARLRTALMSAVIIPVSLLGTIAAIWLAGFSLNNFSIMALVAASGLVVDDAIVVLENISRHIERGLSPWRAAMRGTEEVGFTLLALNLALVVVFVAVLCMGGMMARLFREFSITLAVAVLISLVLSISLIPALSARLLPRAGEGSKHGADPRMAADDGVPDRCSRFSHWGRRLRALNAACLGSLQARYAVTLHYVLRHAWSGVVVLFGLLGISLWLFASLPRADMPEQDTGVIAAFIRGDDAFSFQAMQPRIQRYRQWILSDPAVQDVVGVSGGNAGTSNAQLVITLKPRALRGVSARQVLDRLRRDAPLMAGTAMFGMVLQDLQISPPRFGDDASHQVVLKSGDLSLLRTWTQRLGDALSRQPTLADVHYSKGGDTRQIVLEIDREEAGRLGVTLADVSATLANAFSQRQVAVRYEERQQYRVVMEVSARFTENPLVLDQMQIVTAQGSVVPLSQVARWHFDAVRDRERHVDQFAASTVSFSAAPGVTDQAVLQTVRQVVIDERMPAAVIADIDGDDGRPRSLVDVSGQGWLILGVVAAVYLVLGVLYESLLHPVTVLSAVPAAGVGALLALKISGTPFSLIVLLGLFLLIGIVMKNGILMIDVALRKQRSEGLPPAQAMLLAASQRLRPILMTNLAALAGALPLVWGLGDGGELRQPLGIVVMGGLAVSQIITLYTIPALYLLLERAKQHMRRKALPSWR